MIVWADGFDHYLDVGQLLNGSYAQNTGVTMETLAARIRTGTKALGFNNFGANLRKVLPGVRTAVGASAGFFVIGLPTDTGTQGFLTFADSANGRQIYLYCTTTGVIQVRRNDNTVIGQTAAPVLVANAYQHLEAYVEFSDTVGKVRIRINNTEVLNLANVDTVSSAEVGCAQVTWTTASSNNGFLGYYLDDYYLYDTLGGFNDTYPIGDMQCLPLLPSADTAVTDFTNVGGAATDKDALRDINDVTYLNAAAPGNTSEFDLDDLPANITYIAGIFIHNRIAKSDAGAAQMQTSLLSGASVGLGADRVMSTIPTFYGDSIEKDPATAARWTRLGVNAAKLRIQRTV